MVEEKNSTDHDIVKELFTVGAHIGYSKSHRHPNMEPYIYGVKNRIDVIDLIRTVESIDHARTFLRSIAQQGGTILLLGGKAEAHDVVREAGKATGMPYVAGRWIGGILTNFSQIRRQVDKLQSLREQREKGEFSKYTKREQLSFDREIADLERYYAGLIPLTNKPDVLVIVDPKQESIAVHEAANTGVPIVALANTDCSLHSIQYPIPVNDRSRSAIDAVISTLQQAIQEGLDDKQQSETISKDEKTNTSRSSQPSSTVHKEPVRA